MNRQGILASPVRTLLWHELRISLPIIVGVAGFLSTMFGEPFGTTLVDALCIGLLIQLLIEGGRYRLAARLRRRDPDHFGAQHDWPGWRAMGPWVVVSGIAGYVGGRMLSGVLTGVHRPAGSLLLHPRALLLIMVVVLAASVGSVYFFYARGRMAALETRAQAIQRSAAESQLKLLVSQLEPHMLFNTLANLRVLIGLDPARAQAMLDRLIAFLRVTLEVSRLGSHSLAAEFGCIDDYLELMRIRMGARLRIRLDLPAALAALPMPPLLLQPLVENAIKHGLEPQLDGGLVEVSAAVDGDTLLLTVRDDGAGPAATPAGGGFGMLQVRERLAALYGGAASLELLAAADARGGTVVSVRLPLRQLVPAP
ncbi:MAG: histidine kinase [Pseudomonadota bacterium]|nr:histidine kinase [Pseudomonadota bacterium]